MRAVIQRVTQARVDIAGQTVGSIAQGLLVLLGVEQGDTAEDMLYIAQKTRYLRIFEDEAGKMNRSVLDVGGSILAVSQFTLLGDVRKGRRPDFFSAARPDEANALYEAFVAELRRDLPVETGVFQAEMQVHLCNDGPVTILLDSKRNF